MKPKVVFLKGSKKIDTGLPWWYSVKNPPAKARAVGSIPGLGRLHMLCSNEPVCRSYCSLHTRGPQGTTTERLCHNY